MAATITETKVLPQGQSDALVYGTIALDASYPTGGYTLDPPGSTDYEQLVANAPTVACYYNQGTKKLQVYGSNGAAPALLAEVANTTSLATVVVDFIAVRPT